MKTGFIVLFLFFPMWTAASTCPNTVDLFQNVQAQSFWYKSMNSCAVQITPVDRGPQWRSYLFFSTGMFMVFNNLGPGPAATSTASRSYYFFPRLQHPGYSFHRLGMTVTMANGSALSFDYSTAHIKSFKGVEIAEDPNVTPLNQGGVEILKHGGILIDTGYWVGEGAYSQPERLSRIQDSRGRSCKLINSALFEYVYETDAYGKKYLAEVTFKFEKDKNLGQFLKKQCPSLDVSSLMRSGRSRKVGRRS
jgi:hypothetical protein